MTTVEFIACLAIAAWLLGYRGLLGAIYAVKGQMPPWEQEKSRHDPRGPQWYQPPQYGTRDWIRDIWSDSLEANTAWRRNRAATRRTKAASDEVSVDNTEQVDIDIPLDAPNTSEPKAAEDSKAEDERPLAPVVDLNDWRISMTTTAETEMVDTEVTGLDPAIQLAEHNAASCGRAGTGGTGESYIAYLESEEVSGETLASAYAALELMDAAQEAWARHADKLREQLTVQEAYDNAPDAGSKGFVTGGR